MLLSRTAATLEHERPHSPLRESAALCLHQDQRVQRADTPIPIDMSCYNDRHWILDGVHRLAKLHLMRSEWVALRLDSEENK